ncbi:uncharacterized protein LOC121112611 [Gallus gallus]|uniref:uncharacterized protein LOC121112611 n=1 Tax=Gallus gallus TaxID=9031 RepID=UPI001AE83E67|nr:uncharacterized protein LOC121112611 [Gallus gallus]
MRQCRAEGLAAVLPPAGLGLRGSRAALPSVRPGSMRPHASLSLFCMKFQWEKMDFVSLLLLIFPAVAVSRAQVQQEPSAETSEGIGINITCSHPNIQTSEYIHWYRQLPGRGPAFLVSAVKGSKEVPDPAGWLSVSADRRSSALWLAQPRLGDAAVYYCAVYPRGEEPRLRPGTNRFGRGGGTVPSGPAGGAADFSLPAPPEPALLTWNMSLALLGILRSTAFQLHTFLSTACRGHKHLQAVPAVANL